MQALHGTPNRAHYSLVSGFRHDTGKRFDLASAKFEWSGQQIILPRVPGSPSAGAIIATRGLDATVRGLNKFDVRPQLVAIDDPETEDTVRNEDQAKKLEIRIDRALAYLGGQQRNVVRVMLTTIQNRICISYKFTDPTQKPTWKGKRFRFLIRPPERADLWEEYVAMRKEDYQLYAAGKSDDPHCRRSHQMFLDNRRDMERGAVVANPNRFDPEVLADGSQVEVCALQRYYNEIARTGPEAVATEFDNDPPEDAAIERTVLTAYHVQFSCRSGLQQRNIPDDTAALVNGVDVKKSGLHVSTWAFSAQAQGCCVDYYFYDINTDGLDMQAVELAILRGLHAWREEQEQNAYYDLQGNARFADLSLIDEGWKHESWAGQPVRRFCMEAGTRRFLPCKGESPYRTPRPNRRIIMGDNWHVTFIGRVPVVVMNSDHWKQKVHEGFLGERGAPGSLSLFEPPSSKRGQPHMSFAKHITSEAWERRFEPGYRGWREGWWKVGGQNHYFDATYEALVAKSLFGVSVLGEPTPPRMPEPQSAGPVTTYSRPPSQSRSW